LRAVDEDPFDRPCVSRLEAGRPQGRQYCALRALFARRRHCFLLVAGFFFGGPDPLHRNGPPSTAPFFSTAPWHAATAVSRRYKISRVSNCGFRQRFFVYKEYTSQRPTETRHTTRNAEKFGANSKNFNMKLKFKLKFNFRELAPVFHRLASWRVSQGSDSPCAL
jgi:hypothetical protein